MSSNPNPAPATFLVADRPRAVIDVGHGYGGKTVFVVRPDEERTAEFAPEGTLTFAMLCDGVPLSWCNMELTDDFDREITSMAKGGVFGQGVTRVVVETITHAPVDTLLSDEAPAPSFHPYCA